MPETNSNASVSPESKALFGRYRDAYRVARTIVRFGSTVKAVGMLMGVVIAVISMGLGAQLLPDPSWALLPGAVMGGVVGFVAYVLGVVISALGQILRATIDGAVNSSPLLQDHQKAAIMGLSTSSRTTK